MEALASQAGFLKVAVQIADGKCTYSFQELRPNGLLCNSIFGHPKRAITESRIA